MSIARDKATGMTKYRQAEVELVFLARAIEHQKARHDALVNQYKLKEQELQNIAEQYELAP